MEEPTEKSPLSIAPTLAVAALQGLLLWWIEHSEELGFWPGRNGAWSATLRSVGVFMGPVIYALLPYVRQRAAQVSLLLIPTWLLWSGWLWSVHLVAPGALHPWGSNTFSLLLLQGIVLFHGLPFLQAYLRDRGLSFGYQLLFFDTWQNALQLAVAALFTAILWLLMWLSSQLFSMIGLPFLRVVLFEAKGFWWLVIALAFGVGFHLVGSAERLLTALRQQVLGLLKWLVPVATVIMVAFSIALAIRAPTLVMEQAHVIRAVWLLWLVIVSVYLYNAAYQDGSIATPYPATLGRLIRWATPLLALLAGIALYDIGVRIHSYGLTSSRYWGVVVGITTFAYALGYGFASIRRGPWMGLVGRVNVHVAIGLSILLALSLTPLLSPQRLAARSQANRLAHSAGVAGPDEFMALRFEEGTYGYSELERLAAAPDMPASIRAGAQAALNVKEWRDKYKFAYTTVPSPDVEIESFPKGSVVDTSLKEKILKELPRPTRRSASVNAVMIEGTESFAARNRKGAKLLCSSDLPCPVVFVDLRGDGQQEAVAFIGNRTVVFERGTIDWEKLGESSWRSVRRINSGEALLQTLRSGNYRTIEPRWKLLQVGGVDVPLYLPEGH